MKYQVINQLCSNINVHLQQSSHQVPIFIHCMLL